MKKRLSADAPLSRRELLGLLAALGLSPADAQTQERSVIKTFPFFPDQEIKGTVLSVTAIRPDDLLVVRFVFDGFTGNGKSVIAGAGATLTVLFPGQHVAEEIVVETGAGVETKRRPLRARLASVSRLVFQAPAGATIPFTTEAILGVCEKWPMRLSGQRNAYPAAGETAIEFPTRVILSPEGGVRWEHSQLPVTHDGWTELWHTRLAARPGAAGINAGLRVLAGSDAQLGYESSLRDGHAGMLARSMAQGNPARFERFALSALGAWSDLDYRNDGAGEIESWRHRSAMGRDTYVRIVTRGYLFPFGHRAVLIDTSERRFAPEPGVGGSVGYLVRKSVIVVREPEKSYAQNSPEARAFPFKRVVLKTLATPMFKGTKPLGGALWPQVEGKDFLYHVVGVDHAGYSHDFSTPLAFVAETDSPPGAADIASKLNRPFEGSLVAFAPAGKAGDTTFSAQKISFAGGGKGAGIVPTTTAATLTVPALAGIVGENASVAVAFHSAYKAGGFGGANAAEKLFKLADSLPVAFSAADGGGILTPDFACDALSRKLGAIADGAIGTSFNPATLFPDIEILGGISLKGILGTSIPNLDEAPKLFSEEIDGRLAHRYAWSTSSFVQKDFGPVSFEPKGTKLTMSVTADPGSASCELTKFSLGFLGLLYADFDRLKFDAPAGKKVDVIADVSIRFGGPLSFVNRLQDFIPIDGFSDPPYLDVTTSGIKAGYTLDLPPISIGVFNLTNVSLAAGLELPFFGGSTSIRFAFCERHRPFTLAVGIFGGGGFLAIEANAKDGLAKVEGALEFGGVFGVNLVVASGAVSVMAGIYFSWEKGAINLAGYLRANGALSILGIMTISVEIYLELSYANGIVAGTARVTVEIELLFFSKSVSFEFRREFAGSSQTAMGERGDPGYQVASAQDGAFAPPRPVPIRIPGKKNVLGGAPPRVEELISADDWKKYCEAFV